MFDEKTRERRAAFHRQIRRGLAIRTLCALIILCLLLSACGKGQAPDEGTTEVLTEGQSAFEPTGEEMPATAPIGEQTGHTEPDHTEAPDPVRPAVRSLACMSDAGMILQMTSCGPEEALILCAANETGTEFTLHRVDVEQDSILAQREMAGSQLAGCVGSGRIVTFDRGKQLLSVFDRELQPVAELSYAGNKAVCSPKEDAVYVLNHGTLSRMDLSGRSEQLLSFENGTTIEDVDPESKRVLVSGLPSDDSASFAWIVYSMDGDRLFSTETNADLIGFAYGGIAAQLYGETPDSPDKLLVFCAENGWKPLAYPMNSGVSITALGGAAFLGMSEYTYNTDGSMSTAAAVLDLRSGTVLEVETWLEYRQICYTWMEETNTLLIGASGAAGTELLVVDPSSLPVLEQLSASEPTEPQTEPAETPAYLAELRTRADRLELSYGVRIMFNEQAVRAPMDSSHTAISTGTLPQEREIEALEQALDRLERALSHYPDGFFDRFRNYEGKAGVRFLLVSDLVREEGSRFVTGAVTYSTGGWYNIALKTGVREQDLHHELWHAVEERLAADGVFLDAERWTQLNPEAFVYGADLEQYDTQADEDYLLGTPDHDMAYFINSYSTVNVREDRATLIEFLFEDGTDEREQLNFVRRYYPRLSAKLDYMAEQTSRVFGSAYWE